MNRYYLDNPRGFANEYTVYVIGSPEDEARFRNLYPGAQRITRASAIDYGLRRPRAARRDNQQWYGGFAWSAESEYERSQLRGDPTTDSDEIALAITATRAIMAEHYGGATAEGGTL